MASASNARVGVRIALTVLWTFVLIAGLTVSVLLAAPGIASAVQGALTATLASTGVAAAVAVGMVLLGLWGIASNHRNLKHAVALIAEVDRARKETIQLESTRYMQQPKP
ncbi:MAG: hypothetical protein A3K59_10380 [Euryarchaeota archaeon RBG_19FT_COMBO_69_17]|nr:MAG: hypothetical protein A3K59_10380 [Euryarchaeota archaeon RBG_19FT_COMBO_69_17]